jgi:anti-sigma factor RsiW
MNCEEFEMLMADALGDELSPNDRPVFEAHLAECDCCRQE